MTLTHEPNDRVSGKASGGPPSLSMRLRPTPRTGLAAYELARGLGAVWPIGRGQYPLYALTARDSLDHSRRVSSAVALDNDMSLAHENAASLADEAIVRLRVRHGARIETSLVPIVLGSPEAVWLGERADEGDDRRHFACDLELRVRPESLATFHKAAIVSLGTPVKDNVGWVVPCEWRASGLAPLFPVFSGNLRFDPDGITLEGYCAPPFGVLGFALDRALLGIAARGTARWFLRRVAAQLA